VREERVDDIPKLQAFFRDCKAKNPQIFCEFQLDDENVVRNVFWSHASQQGDYAGTRTPLHVLICHWFTLVLRQKMGKTKNKCLYFLTQLFEQIILKLWPLIQHIGQINTVFPWPCLLGLTTRCRMWCLGKLYRGMRRQTRLSRCFGSFRFACVENIQLSYS
jgi:hypothetical protein